MEQLGLRGGAGGWTLLLKACMALMVGVEEGWVICSGVARMCVPTCNVCHAQCHLCATCACVYVCTCGYVCPYMPLLPWGVHALEAPGGGVTYLALQGGAVEAVRRHPQRGVQHRQVPPFREAPQSAVVLQRRPHQRLRHGMRHTWHA